LGLRFFQPFEDRQNLFSELPRLDYGFEPLVYVGDVLALAFADSANDGQSLVRVSGYRVSTDSGSLSNTFGR